MNDNINPIPDESNNSSVPLTPSPLSDPNPIYDQAVISWTAPEYLQHARGPAWYLVVGIISAIFLIYSVYTNAWSMVISFIVIAGIYYLLMNKKPRLFTVKISPFGIKVGAKTYPYSHIKGFWVIYKPPRTTTLNIRIADRFANDIAIQLGHQNPADVRNFLLHQIPEFENKEETLADLLSHLFRI